MTTETEVEPKRLQYRWQIFFSRRAPGGKVSSVSSSYDQNLKLICGFQSVKDFWTIYAHLIRPNQLSGHCDLHVFKHGIRPLWEDDANKDGGKWIVRLRKGLSSRCWENLLLALLGEQFMVGHEITGVVVSCRFQEDIISVWNRTASDTQTTVRIRDTLKRVLNLPPNVVLEYKAHSVSLMDNTSYRNTFVR